MTDKDSNGKVRAVTCTHCGSANTELMGLFGPFHLASQYYCRDCRSPFARVKWQAENPTDFQSGDTRQ